MLISSITYRDLFIYIFGRCVHCIGMQHVSITRRLQWNIYTFLRDYFFTWISDHWAMAWAISGHFYLSEKLEVSLSVFCQIIRKYENLHTFGYCQLILCCFSFNNLCCNQGKVKWKLRNLLLFISDCSTGYKSNKTITCSNRSVFMAWYAEMVKFCGPTFGHVWSGVWYHQGCYRDVYWRLDTGE